VEDPAKTTPGRRSDQSSPNDARYCTLKDIEVASIDAVALGHSMEEDDGVGRIAERSRSRSSTADDTNANADVDDVPTLLDR
jgi:hypothetical protein